MKLTIVDKRREEDQHEMIALSCRTSLSHINKNHLDTMYLIQSLCSSYKLRYSHQLGSICAHVSYHVALQNQGKKKDMKGQQQREDWKMVNRLVNKYNLVFFQHKFINNVEAHRLFSSFQDLVSYTMKCIAYPLEEQMVYHLNTKEKYKQRLRKISERLLKSLLFEYIPREYSLGVLTIYLEEKLNSNHRQSTQTEEQFQVADLHPYLNFFQMVGSLSCYLVQKLKPVNLEHYLGLIENPVMGIVEWPMVIGGRDIDDLPPIFIEEGE